MSDGQSPESYYVRRAGHFVAATLGLLLGAIAAVIGLILLALKGVGLL